MGFKMVWTNTEPNHPSIRVKINAITSGHFIVGLWEKYLIAKKSGVKFLAYRCLLSSKEIKIEKKINIIDE